MSKRAKAVCTVINCRQSSDSYNAECRHILVDNNEVYKVLKVFASLQLYRRFLLRTHLGFFAIKTFFLFIHFVVKCFFRLFAFQFLSLKNVF